MISRGIITAEDANNFILYVKVVGDIFVRLIKMLVVPLVLISIVSAIIGMDNLRETGSLGLQSFIIYMVTTSFAIFLALFVSELVDLGVNANLKDMLTGATEITHQERSVRQMIIEIFPSSVYGAFVSGKMLQIITFAIMLSFAIKMAGSKGKLIADYVDSFNEVINQLVNIVMSMAPYGVFCLITWVVSTQDKTTLSSFLYLILCTYFIAFLHIFFVHGGMVLLIAKKRVLWFLARSLPANLTAYSTSSSAATLPVTMRIAQEKLGVSKSTSSFVLPLGTTINMDGTAIYLGIVAVFTAHGLGVDLSLQQYFLIAFTATLASIGTAGVPSASLIMLTLVLSTVDLPLEIIGIIAAFDRVNDMMRTTVNVSGDLATAMVVDKLQGRS